MAAEQSIAANAKTLWLVGPFMIREWEQRNGMMLVVSEKARLLQGDPSRVLFRQETDMIRFLFF